MVKAYFQSENLKYKRTFARKLPVIAPILLLILGLIAPMWFQINTFNWWYCILYPGVLTLLCIMVNRKDSGKLKCRAIIPMPVSLKKVWAAKIAVCVTYVQIANLIFALGNILGGLLIKNIFEVKPAVSAGAVLLAVICIEITTIWEIPFCLWLSQKIGMWGTLIWNLGASCILGILLASEKAWIASPYSWAIRLMVPVLGIQPNGCKVNGLELSVSSSKTILVLMAALFLFGFLSVITTENFQKEEVR